MRKVQRRFFVTFFLTFIVGLMVLPVINFSIDRWRVLSKDFHNAYTDVKAFPYSNANFLRLEYLLRNRSKYDSVIFGSSRVFQGIGTDSLENHLGGSWFKFTVPGGTLNEHVYHLEFLIKEGFKLKRVAVGLDDFLFFVQPNRTQDSLNLKLYPGNMFAWLEFYMSYLFKPLDDTDFQIMSGEITLKEHPWTLDLYVNKGRLPAPDRDAAKHKERMYARKTGKSRSVNAPDYKPFVDGVSQIVSLCKENNIELILFVTPRHYKRIYKRNLNYILGGRRELASIHPFYDFSWITPLTKDQQNWFDLSHFSGLVGEELVRRLAIRPALQNGFGARVTSDNLDSYIEDFINNRLSNLEAIVEEDSNTYIHPSYRSFSRLPVVVEHPDADSL